MLAFNLLSRTMGALKASEFAPAVAI